MMNNIDCEVIQDLFPSYIDGLTCEKTNVMIEEHLTGCEKCRSALAAMKETSSEILEMSPEDKKEIDFLRKNKKINFRIIIGSVVGAFLLVLFMITLGCFVVGTKNDTNWMAMHLNVEDNEMDFIAVPFGSGNAIASIYYTEEAGVVMMHARTVLVSPFHKGNLEGRYVASETIKEVRIGNRIIWSEGAPVTAFASDLYATRHSYIGAMSDNNHTALALNMGTSLGAFTNELETSSEPYGWKIILSEDVSSDKLAQKEQDMEAFGYVILGLIENLDHVTYVYHSEGVEKMLTITAEDASTFLGEDIKKCSKHIRTLDTLLQKTGLMRAAY